MLYLLRMDDSAAKLQTAIHLLNDPTDQPVSDWMTADGVSVDPDTVSADATETMLAGRFRYLPVMQGGVLGGIVSMRDLLGVRIHPT